MTTLPNLSTPPPDCDLASHPLPPLPIGPSLQDWQRQRVEQEATWTAYLGHGPEVAPLEPEALHSDAVGAMTRSLVSYQVEDGCGVSAYLITAPGEGPFPAVVVYHPTTHDTIREAAGLASPP